MLIVLKPALYFTDLLVKVGWVGVGTEKLYPYSTQLCWPNLQHRDNL